MTSNANAPPAAKEERRYCPVHVPKDMIRSLDSYNDPRMSVDPLGTVRAASDGLRVYWDDVDAGFKKGCWVLTRAEDIREVLSKPEIFRSNNWVKPQALAGAKWKLIPNGLDGAEHQAFREYMTEWFSPVALKTLTAKVAALSAELIDGLQKQGGCEFVSAFARPLPISIVLDLIGLPRERLPEFMQWEGDMLHSSDFSKAAAATKNVLDVLRELIAARHVTPTDDLASRNIKALVMGRAVTDDENLSMLFSMYLGGLDTVATALAWQFHELATNQALQDRLRRNLQQVPAAVDEMLRRFSMVTVRRQAVVDHEIAGVSIKAGDWVQMPTTLGSTDPDEYSDPLEVDLDRKGVRHFAFAYGKHFCLGFRLARQELIIAMTQWLERLPSFRLSDPAGVVFHGGQSFGLLSLPLTWT